MRPQGVAEITFAVCIPSKVQPVPPPSLTEMRRFQQLINEPSISPCSYGRQTVEPVV
jgi:hypothetical protein